MSMYHLNYLLNFVCGKLFILQSIADSELEQELGITNSLHRLKLRLAVHEIVSITSTEKLHRTVRMFMQATLAIIVYIWYMYILYLHVHTCHNSECVDYV